MVKKIFLLAISILIVLVPTVHAKAYDRDIIIPTAKKAVVDEKIKSKIEISKETSMVEPWVYVDVKLNATKAKQGKYNYAELALKRAYGFFTENKLSIGDGDFYIILDNGFIINKKNYLDKNVTKEAKKQILDKDFYRGDTLFKLAFLYHDNAVERLMYWKLIDTIDLPAGSTHTLTKKYTVGVNKSEELNIGQTLGLNLITGVESSGGFDCKFASAKILAKLNAEVNKTVQKTFKNNKAINSTYESNTKISYNANNESRVILRYQLVDNYRVDRKSFKDATLNLNRLMNEGGVNIVEVEPTSGEEGVEVPMDQTFDVTITK